MQFLAPAAAVALLAIPAILALYLLKVRRPEAPVPTLQLWSHHAADRQADAPWQRLRPSVLLLVQLLIAAALALALMRPGLPGRAGLAFTTVVMIDGSPSMLATDVAPNRFGAALSRAREMASQLGPEQEMALIVLGRHAQLLASPTNDAGALRAALERARPAGEAANLEEGISVANAVLSGRPQGSVVLLSDGIAERPTPPPPVAAPLRYQSVGTSADNAAIETIGRTPEGDVFLRMANFGARARDAEVEMRADGRLVDVVPVTIEPSSSVEHTWTGLPGGTAAVEARLTPGDDLALDDSAWLLTELPTRRRVLLVTPENGFVERALEVRPDLDVTVVEPADYRPALYDLYVFDRFVPPEPFPHPALVLAPPDGAGPLPAGPDIDPGAVLPANPREPLLQYVSLRDVHVQEASPVDLPPDWRTVIDAVNGPLLVVHQGEPRVAQLTFDVHRSDLPLRPAFPILIQNLASYLLPGGFESQVLSLGAPARLVTEPGATSVEVTTPAGGRHQLVPASGGVTVTDTTVPGIYTVRQTVPTGIRTSRFVVHLQNASQSRIAPGPAPVIETLTSSPGPAPRGVLEISPWLALAALLGLGVECLIFLRG